ncbi:hypothetical protein INR49_008522 [Caranx melampygus]|nr:hypothetical protein INR49_008522 [Caranx melampygus]
MENDPGEKEINSLPEVRVILIGGRWAGKSSSGNTILRKERFECGRTRTAQSEVRHEIVEGKMLTVVDAPGWKSSFSLTDIPEGDKQRFKLNPSRCPPGPQAFLLVIPIDSAFSVEQKRIVEEHMKLLGQRVWRYTMVLFTCGDFLGKKTIEQHIESEGDALKWLIERCKKMDDIPSLRLVLLGSRRVGKTSVGNAILGIKEQDDGKRTEYSVAHSGSVGKTKITFVDTPGWWKGFPAFDTPEAIKEELQRSMFLCPPGPHVFLVVIDADASFNGKHLDALTSHVGLLGEGVWRHTIVVFTRGDWLGSRTIEEYIEGEGEALQSLVDQCGNRYHVIDNKNTNDGTQITELLEKITATVAGNSWSHFVPDEQKFKTIEERRRRVEEMARLRESQVKAMRKIPRDHTHKLQELRIVILGQKTSGKSATGNNLLRKEVIPTHQNEICQVYQEDVAGRRITVIDTPGWWSEPSHCTEEIDKEIVRGFSLSPLGVHAVLLVIPLDLAFRKVHRDALEEHMNLLDATVWKHTMVLFTYGDKLAGRSVEEHIERELGDLHWLVDKCENKYHVMNNMKKADTSQVIELFEKTEEMVAGNNGHLFCPDMKDIHLRIDNKFKRRQVKYVLKHQLEKEYRRRELELMIGFRTILLDLQAEISGSETSTKAKAQIGDMSKLKIRGIGHKKKDGKEKEENIETKISKEIEDLNKNILKSMTALQSSMDALIPDLNGESPIQFTAGSLSGRRNSTDNFDRVLGWLSTLQISTNAENNLTLNFSQTSSGYRSVLSQVDLDFTTEADIPQ